MTVERQEVEVLVGGMGTVHALGPPECVEAIRQVVAERGQYRAALVFLYDGMREVERQYLRMDHPEVAALCEAAKGQDDRVATERARR